MQRNPKKGSARLLWSHGPSRGDPISPKLGGAKIMGKYEIMYILSAELDDAARKAEIEKLHGILASEKIEVKNVNEWGVRDFAYPINKKTKGYYVIVKVVGEAAGLKEFDRLAKLDNNVIRFLVTVDQD